MDVDPTPIGELDHRLGLGLPGVFAAIAASLIVYGLLIGGALLLKPWRAR